MFHFGVGWQELLLLLLIAVPLVFTRGKRRRWVAVLAVMTAIGVVLTPADPLSAILVASPLTIAFALGVAAAPHLGRVDGPAGG